MKLKNNIKTEKGITLIALVITIIVMLILVGVTINLVTSGNLFNYARNAAGETKNSILYEQELANVDLSQYVNGGGTGGGDDEPLPFPEDSDWSVCATLPSGWNGSHVTAITDGTYTVPIPNGYSVIKVNNEAKVEKGLVIKDTNENEFVWIPVDPSSVAEGTIAAPYNGGGGNYKEPVVLSSSYDGDTVLTNNYGSGYFTYPADFDYEAEYEEMTRQVKKYGGFYIGRYETTIETINNKQCIGSVGDRKVLTADQEIFIKGTAETKVCRWYGLYYVQKTTDYVVGNGTNVQTAMVYGQLWDKAMDFIRSQKTAENTSYDVDTKTDSWHGSANGHTAVVNSGKANAGDVALNIFDLESNGLEWTQEASSTNYRAKRGGNYLNSYSASHALRRLSDQLQQLRCVSSLTLYKIAKLYYINVGLNANSDAHVSDVALVAG